MNHKQARHLLNLKLQTRVNEAKCKAMAEDKLMVNMFWHDMQQLNYENIHNKLAIAHASKKLSGAHHKYLSDALHQYSSAIKSNRQLLETVNTQIERLMDKEKDLLELQEETALGVTESMDLEFDSIIQDNNRSDGFDDVLPYMLPPVPTDKVKSPERKKAITFGDVIIKTMDEVESEKEENLVPTDKVKSPERKKAITFADVIIKTMDEVESEKEEYSVCNYDEDSNFESYGKSEDSVIDEDTTVQPII